MEAEINKLVSLHRVGYAVWEKPMMNIPKFDKLRLSAANVLQIQKKELTPIILQWSKASRSRANITKNCRLPRSDQLQKCISGECRYSTSGQKINKNCKQKVIEINKTKYTQNQTDRGKFSSSVGDFSNFRVTLSLLATNKSNRRAQLWKLLKGKHKNAVNANQWNYLLIAEKQWLFSSSQ